MKRYIVFYFSVMINFFKNITFKNKLKAIKQKGLDVNSEEFKDEVGRLLKDSEWVSLEKEIDWVLAVTEIASWFQLDMKNIKTTVAFRKILNGILPTIEEENTYNTMLHSQNVRKSVLEYMVLVGDVEPRRVDFYLETHPEKKQWLLMEDG